MPTALPTKKAIPVVKKPVPKLSEAAAKPSTPAIIQTAGPKIDPETAKRLAALEKELADTKALLVTAQEKAAKANEDKNAWRNIVYLLADVEKMGQSTGEQPISEDDWRKQYHDTWQFTYPMSVAKDGTINVHTDMPPRLVLCLIPSSKLPLEPGETEADMRMQRRDGFLAYWDDIHYNEQGEPDGVIGTPRQAPESVFAQMLIPQEEEAAPEPEPTPEPPKPAPAASGKKGKIK